MKKKKIIIFVSAAIITLLTFFAVLQTKTFQKKIKNFVTTTIEKNNLPVKFENIKVVFPFNFKVENLEIFLNDKKIKIEKTNFRISFFPLIFKKINFNYFKAQNIYIEELNKKTPDKKTLKKDFLKEKSFINFPFSLSFKTLNLQNIHINSLNFSIKGKAFLKKNLNSLFLDLSIKKQNFKNSYIDILCIKPKKGNFIDTSIKLKSKSLKFLKPFYKNEIPDGNLFLNISSKIPMQELENFLKSKNLKNQINAKISGYFNPLFFQKYEKIKKLEIDLNLNISNDLSIKIPSIKIENNLLKALGSANIEKRNLKNLNLTLNTNNLYPLSPLLKVPISGNIDLSFNFLGKTINLELLSKNLHLQNLPLDIEAKAFLEKEIKDKVFKGTLNSKIFFLKEIFSLTSNISWENFLSISNIYMSSPSSKTTGNLKISKNLTGNINSTFENLNILKEINPKFAIDGTLNIFSTFLKNSIETTAILKNFQLKSFFGEEIKLNFFSKNLKKNILEIFLKNSRHHKLKIDSFSFKTDFSKENWPFETSLNGKLITPLEIKSNGFWKYFKENSFINIQNFSGLFLKEPFSLSYPTYITFGKNSFSLKNFEILMPASSLNAKIDLSKENADIRIVADHFPIDFLSINPLDLSVSGYSSIEATLNKTGKNIESKADILLEKTIISTIFEDKPLNIEGKIKAHIENENFKFRGKILAKNNEHIEFDASIPIKDLSFMPLTLKVDKLRDMKAFISMKGRAEDILDFIDIKNNRLEGDVNCNIEISKNLLSPEIDGFCSLKNAVFENYFTGIYLNNLNANIKSKNHLISLESLEASDGKKGKIKAHGNLDLRASQNYPFNLNFNFSKILLLNSPIIKAFSSGDLSVKGNKLKALASGKIKIDEADLTIPEKLKYSLPDLDVEFVNKKKEKTAFKEKKPYPLNLNLELFSKDKIYVKGRGVNAEMKGKIKLAGSLENILTDGKLELVKGNYLFSGKPFTLTEGSLLFFPGKPPMLSVKAETMEKGVLITAKLQGPLNSPSLSFSSTPSLPISSIISLLLFGEDLSGISGIQALQVASTVASLSEGGSILEATKKSLGIDRLTIVSRTADDPDDPDKMAVQVGKYVTRGVLVSYTQGTEEGSSNVSAEIDLGYGFVLQLETIQEEEQTRYTIKWNKSY